MNISKIYSIVIALLFVSSFQQFYAQEISREKEFFYFVKIHSSNIDEYIIDYAKTFDAYNYNKSKSDEFEKNNYINKIRNIITRGVDKVDFNEKFVVKGTGVLGEYNFNETYFPISSWSFDIDRYFEDASGLGKYFKIPTNCAINLGDFNGLIKMSVNAANNFIKKRKYSQGNIDRNIYLKVTYSIVDNKIPNTNNVYYFYSYVYSIEIYNDNLFTNKIGVLYPTKDYADKVHGIEIKEGQKTIYYKEAQGAFWSGGAASIYKSGILPSKESAKYYRVINYSDGKIVEVKDYYISGELEMEGVYDPYCIEPRCANGLFTWYYKNGFKRQEVNIVNGKMEGCVYQWNKKGECEDEYSCLMKDDYVSGRSNNCPCANQKEKKIINKTSELEYGSFTDSRDGKVYKTVKIGTQTWMAENLDVSFFNNGDVIPEFKTDKEWIKSGNPAWCYYDNNPDNGNKYGKLYNWYAVNDKRGLAPKGWHIATENEYKTLIFTADDDGNALKSNGQGKGEGAGTNTSGFSALLGGYRWRYGDFNKLAYEAEFWSSTGNGNVEIANYIYLNFDDNKITLAARYSECGYSVRCIKD